MALHITNLVRGKACAENGAENTEAGQQASPQRDSHTVIRSISERKPVLPLLGKQVAHQRNATAPGSPGNRTVEQARGELSNQSRPSSPLSTKLVRRINRLAGDENDKRSRSLLRLHGDDAVRGNDPLAPLNIDWMISVEEPAPGEPSRATPPRGCISLATDSPPSLPVSAAAAQRKRSLMTAAEAFFHYPGPDGDAQQFAQWLRAHPLHRMFLQVYPISDAISSLEQDIRTPLHTVLEDGISDPMRFHRSLMKTCEQADSRFAKPEMLFRDAVAVSRQAVGQLQKQADFFSRFFSVLIALETVPDQHEKARISESLRQEWLETDFSLLLDPRETRPPQVSQLHWQAAEPARTQTSGRRTFADAMGRGDMSPRKKQKTVHHQEASTPATDGHQAWAWQTPDSPGHASPRTLDADSDAGLSPPSDKYRSPIESRSLSWKTSILKRKPKLPEHKFHVWLSSISATGVSASPVHAQQSPVQQAGDLPVSGTGVTPVALLEKPSSN